MQKRKVRRTIKSAVDLKTMRSISSDELLSLSADDYQTVRRQATRARLDHRVRYGCSQCGYAVYAPREAITGLPYWKHHSGAPEDCPWWTGVPASVDSVSRRQFDGAQESPLHLKIKNIVGELLNDDVRTEHGSVIVDQYLITERGRRRPDVRAIYDGVAIAIEVQLATTQIVTIIQRENFYENEGYRLLWLTWNFEPPMAGGRLLSSFEDIFHSHNKNLFSLDDETVGLSKELGELCLRVFWMSDDGWMSEVVRLSELQWLSDGHAFAVAPPQPWHEDFLARWLAATDERGTHWRERRALISELNERLLLAEADERELEDAGIEAVINCLLSLREGHPIGSRQKNLIEVLNTFLYAEGRHRYARIARRFAELTGNSDSLMTSGVQKKLGFALSTPQDDPQSVIGRIVLGLFPQIFLHGRTRRNTTK